VSSCSNTGSIRDDPYWISWKNNLELIELSTINKYPISFRFRLIKVFSPCVLHDRTFVPVWFSYSSYFSSEVLLHLQTAWWPGAAFLYVIQISELLRESEWCYFCVIFLTCVFQYLEIDPNSVFVSGIKLRFSVVIWTQELTLTRKWKNSLQTILITGCVIYILMLFSYQGK
jgi:hypothetical protein